MDSFFILIIEYLILIVKVVLAIRLDRSSSISHRKLEIKISSIDAQHILSFIFQLIFFFTASQKVNQPEQFILVTFNRILIPLNLILLNWNPKLLSNTPVLLQDFNYLNRKMLVDTQRQWKGKAIINVHRK